MNLYSPIGVELNWNYINRGPKTCHYKLNKSKGKRGEQTANVAHLARFRNFSDPTPVTFSGEIGNFWRNLKSSAVTVFCVHTAFVLHPLVLFSIDLTEGTPPPPPKTFCLSKVVFPLSYSLDYNNMQMSNYVNLVMISYMMMTANSYLPYWGVDSSTDRSCWCSRGHVPP